MTRRHRRAEPSRARRASAGTEDTDPFDRWVDRQLRALYGPVADEPLPPRLRELIDEAGQAVDDERAAPDGGSGDGADGDDRRS